MSGKPVLWLWLAVFVTACSERQQEPPGPPPEPVPVKYASGFHIGRQQGGWLLTVTTPYKEASRPLRYLLYPRGSKPPPTTADARIPVPVRSLVCTSTTHIPLLDYLGETAALTGFPTLGYISSAAMRQRIDSGLVAELGVDDALNIEKVVALQPDMVMAYSLSGDMGQFALLQEAGIPVLLNAEYLERHPLGRAEWIKVAGLLFGKAAMADSIFSAIEREYLATARLAAADSLRPSVFSGIVYGDSWYLPGGRNYAARLLQDAGFRYLWAADTTSAFLPLSFEAVLERAATADYWIGVGSYRTLAEIKEADSRYTLFRAFRQGQVYSYNKRLGPGGGSEFLELGYLRPDLILKDLVKIGHPHLLPGYELFFYFKLPS